MSEWKKIEDELLTHWMEAPELPVKEHGCINGGFTCIKDPDGDFQVLNVLGNVMLYCDYCPFCGEKAY